MLKGKQLSYSVSLQNEKAWLSQFMTVIIIYTKF